MANRFATKEPTLCAVCRRHAVWIGYHAGGQSPVIWLCDDSNCHAIAKKVYAMPQRILEAYEIVLRSKRGRSPAATLKRSAPQISPRLAVSSGANSCAASSSVSSRLCAARFWKTKHRFRSNNWVPMRYLANV